MTACTQPGCTGKIIDGYCDVCGSPVEAVPFVSAMASTESIASAAEAGLSSVGGGPGVTAKSGNGELSGCTQPGCTGTILDGYCDVCGSPADAVPFASATGSAASDTGAGTADSGHELAEGESRVQEYRTRVEEAQLPDDVREAALHEVGKLERTSAKSAECREIRTWLDTILGLPWRTKIIKSIDIQGSGEVEATLRRLIEPTGADVEKGDTVEVEPVVIDVVRADVTEAEPPAADVAGDAAEVEPSAVADVVQDATEGEPPPADLEKADTAARDLEHDNPAKMPAPAGVLSEDGHARPQVLEQQLLEPEPVQTPAKRRGFGYVAAAATVLAALLVGALLFTVTRDRGVTTQSVPAVTATATGTEPTSGPSNGSTNTAEKEPTIQLENPPETARASQTVRIDGRYRSGPDSFVQAQRWEGGRWVDFPLPAKADKSGRFTTFIELWQPGRYRLRVVDPHSGVRSKTFVLVVTG
jgi:hypothetical protein